MGPIDEGDVLEAEVVEPAPAEMDYENHRLRVGGPRWWWAIVQVCLATSMLAIALTLSVAMLVFSIRQGEFLPGLCATIAAGCFAYPAVVLYRSSLPVLLRTSDRIKDPKQPRRGPIHRPGVTEP